MTATDRLRALLDERGVEWRLVNGDCILWTDADGATYSARDGFTFAGPDGTVTVFNMTPEQAVAATLGRGTCKVESSHGYTDPFAQTRYCFELSCHVVDDWGDRQPPEYCPYCGRKVAG